MQSIAGGNRRGDGLADLKLGAGGRRAAAPIENDLHQWQEFAGHSELAIRRVPSGGERKKAAFANLDFRQGRRAIIEFRQHTSRKVRWNRQAPVFPNMDAREIAEPRVGERRENWVGEIYLAEQRVIARRLADLHVSRPC